MASTRRVFFAMFLVLAVFRVSGFSENLLNPHGIPGALHLLLTGDLNFINLSKLVRVNHP